MQQLSYQNISQLNNWAELLSRPGQNDCANKMTHKLVNKTNRH